jgi:hypothetical protein
MLDDNMFSMRITESAIRLGMTLSDLIEDNSLVVCEIETVGELDTSSFKNVRVVSPQYILDCLTQYQKLDITKYSHFK